MDINLITDSRKFTLKLIILGLLFIRIFTNLVRYEYFPFLGVFELNVSGIIALSIILLSLVILIIFINQNNFKIRLNINELNFSIILFIVLVLISSLVNLLDPNNNIFSAKIFLERFLRLISPFCLYYIINNLFVTKKDIIILHKFLISIILFTVFVGLYQLFPKINKLQDLSLTRWFSGISEHPNQFSLILVFYSVILIFYLYYLRGIFSKFFIGILLFFLIIFIFISTSRTGIFLLFFSFGLIFIEFYRKKVIIVIFSVFVLLTILLLPFYIERLSILGSPWEAIRNVFINRIGSSTTSFEWRFLNFRGLIEIYKEKPFFGWGLGTDYLVNPYRPFDSHNDYLKFLVETGLVGFLGYLFLYYNILKYLFRKFKKTLNKYRLFIYSLICFFVGYLLISFFSNNFFSLLFQYYFWLIIALIGNLDNIGNLQEGDFCYGKMQSFNFT